MKTIKQMAESLGVTRQTIYNIVNDTPGMSIDDLTTARQGKTRLFDAEAEKTVKKLLSERRNCKATQDNAKEAELAEAKRQIQKLAEDLQRAEARIDELIQTNRAQSVSILKLQEANQTKLMASAGDADRKPGRIARAWKALMGKE